MTYLVDTDWVAAYLKGRAEAIQRLDALAEDGLAISVITYGEIYEGIYYGRAVKQHEQGFLNFLQGVDVLPLNRTIMKRFAQMRGHLRSQGQLIGNLDVLIAATALYHNLTLITSNTRHFSRIPDLTLYQSG
jgi:predicted nucleic acid-binding protein